jgi:hypothetical protein
MSAIENTMGYRILSCEAVAMQVCRAIFADFIAAGGPIGVSTLQDASPTPFKKTKVSPTDMCQRLFELAGYLIYGTEQIFRSLFYNIEILGLEDILEVLFSVTVFFLFQTNEKKCKNVKHLRNDKVLYRIKRSKNVIHDFSY